MVQVSPLHITREVVMSWRMLVVAGLVCGLVGAGTISTYAAGETERPQRVEKPEKPQKPERAEKLQKPERPQR
jgi:hypothetical protein